jgi:hypothetical protein
MGSPAQRKRGQVSKSQRGPAAVHGTIADLPPPHRGDFEVDKAGRCQLLPAEAGPGVIAVLAVIGEGNGQDAGVNDDHGRRAASLPPSLAAHDRRSGRRPGQGLPRGSAGWLPRLAGRASIPGGTGGRRTPAGAKPRGCVPGHP